MKKGFTLIELLAVIVILAIIALIAVPQILGVISEARKGSAKDSVYGLVNAIENQMVINEMDTDSLNDIKDKDSYTISELLSSPYNVKLKGSDNLVGNVKIENHKITRITVKVKNQYDFIYENNIVNEM